MGKLTNAPVAYVLAQVVFEECMSIEKYLPDFQETIRKKYPKNNQKVVHTLSIAGDGAPPKVSELRQWHFKTKSNTAGFIVQSNSFAFHVTEYEDFETFIGEFHFGLSALNSSVGMQVLERVGIRYVDRIVAEPEEKIADYIDSSVTGFTYDFDASDRVQTYCESVDKTRHGTLVSKYFQTQKPEVLPRDLMPTDLDVKESDSETCAFLDFDHYIRESQDFSVDGSIDILTNLQECSSLAFRATISEHAKEKWK